MSSRVGGGRGGGGRGVFLSAHRCPEVDLLPYHDSDTQIPVPCSLVPAEKSSGFTCIGGSEVDYLDVSSTCRCEEEEEDEEGGSISDWSEEDLSFHFSPFVILPSDDEDSGPESGFECVDVTMETQVNGQEREGLKMVPKRQIHLKKKKDADSIICRETTDKPEVTLKDGGAQLAPPPREVSGCHRPDLLLRQHSTPASFHTCSTTSSDVITNVVYRGLIAGAHQGFQVGSTEGQRRLQKSFSLDETKTKMASCIIKSVLSKKMQVEQKTSHLKKKPQVLPVDPPPVEQQRGREWGRTGVFKAPVHVGKDVASLDKNTCSLTLPTTTPENHKPTSFSVIGQEHSPPPTYQQALGVRCYTAASLSQSHDKKRSDTSCHPITQQGRGSEPITSRDKAGEVMLVDPPTIPPVTPPPPSTTRLPHGTQALLSTQEQSSILGVPSQSAPGSSQVLHPCFYTPPTLHPHLGQVRYVQTQLQPPPPTPIHLLKMSEENQNRSTGNSTAQIMETCPPRTTGDHEGHGSTVTAATQQEPQPQQQQQQRLLQPFLCSVQSFLPAQVSGSFLVDATGSPGSLLPGPLHMMLDPISGRCFYVDPPPQLQSKMLLDPETGQLVQVYLPAASSAVCGANPTPAVVQVGGANPPLLSVMQFQPTVAVSSLYAPPCLPFTLHTPSVYTAP